MIPTIIITVIHAIIIMIVICIIHTEQGALERAWAVAIRGKCPIRNRLSVKSQHELEQAHTTQ
eukprot:8876752-Prorocentrum_lima.AAC.1